MEQHVFMKVDEIIELYSDISSFPPFPAHNRRYKIYSHTDNSRQKGFTIFLEYLADGMHNSEKYKGILPVHFKYHDRLNIRFRIKVLDRRASPNKRDQAEEITIPLARIDELFFIAQAIASGNTSIFSNLFSVKDLDNNTSLNKFKNYIFCMGGKAIYGIETWEIFKHSSLHPLDDRKSPDSQNILSIQYTRKHDDKEFKYFPYKLVLEVLHGPNRSEDVVRKRRLKINVADDTLYYAIYDMHKSLCKWFAGDMI